MAFLPAGTSAQLHRSPSQQQNLPSTSPSAAKMQISTEAVSGTSTPTKSNYHHASSPGRCPSSPTTPGTVGTTVDCPPSPGARPGEASRQNQNKKSMSSKLKSLRRRMSGRRPGAGALGTGSQSNVTAGEDGSNSYETRSPHARSGHSASPVRSAFGRRRSDDTPTIVEVEALGNPQGAPDAEREYYDDRRQTIDGTGVGETDPNYHASSRSHEAHAHLPSANETAPMAATYLNYHSGVSSSLTGNSHMTGAVPNIPTKATSLTASSSHANSSSRPPTPEIQGPVSPNHDTNPTFRFISDDNFTRRVDSYDGQVIVCSDSRLPTYEVGNYLGGGVAGVVYEGKRLRPANEYPPVRIRGGGAYYPKFVMGGGNGGAGANLSSMPPVAMSMTSSSLSSMRRRITVENDHAQGTGLFAEVHRAIVPEAYRGSAHSQFSPGRQFSPMENYKNGTSSSDIYAHGGGAHFRQSQFIHKTTDDSGGCTSFIFGNCGNDVEVEDKQGFPRAGMTPMNGHLDSQNPDSLNAARQRYLAVDMASIEVPAAFSSLEQETPNNASVHHVVVDDADAPNRSKREARALSRNLPSSTMPFPQPGIVGGGDSAIQDSSSLLYHDDIDAFAPQLIEDISETVAIKILNPVGFRLLDPEQLHKAVIVREGILPTVEHDGSFTLTEEHVWWLVNPNSRNLRSLLRKNHSQQSVQAGHSSKRFSGGDEDASEDSFNNLQRNRSSFTQSGVVDRGTPERGLRLSLVATYVDPITSTLKELPLPRCVEIWGHPPFAATDDEFEAMMDALLRLNAGTGSGIRRKKPLRRMGDSRSPSFSEREAEYYDPLASRRGGSTVYCPALSAYIAVPVIPPKYLRWLKQRRLATKEVRNMMRIGRHRNVVHLYEVLELVQDSKSTMFLILELVRGGELFDLISSNSNASSKRKSGNGGGASADDLHEATMRNFFRELASGINYIHQCGVAHRDLKPENLLIHTKAAPTDTTPGNPPPEQTVEEERTLKIADFGLSAAFELHSNEFWSNITRGDSGSKWDGGSTVVGSTHASRDKGLNPSRHNGVPLSPNSGGRSVLSPLLNRVGATALSYLTCGSMTNVCSEEGIRSDLADEGFGGNRVPLRRMTSVVGSPHYVAPEIISQATIERKESKSSEKGRSKSDMELGSKKVSSKGGYDGTKADVWSAGVILYAMLFRSLPFGEDLLRCPRYQAFQKWYQEARQLQPPMKGKRNRRTFPENTLDPTYDEWDEEEMLGPHWFFPHEISVEGRDLIVAMLNPDPFDRLTIDMVLQHPWLRRFDMDRDSSVPRMSGLCLSRT